MLVTYLFGQKPDGAFSGTKDIVGKFIAIEKPTRAKKLNFSPFSFTFMQLIFQKVDQGPML